MPKSTTPWHGKGVFEKGCCHTSGHKNNQFWSFSNIFVSPCIFSPSCGNVQFIFQSGTFTPPIQYMKHKSKVLSRNHYLRPAGFLLLFLLILTYICVCMKPKIACSALQKNSMQQRRVICYVEAVC